MTLEKQITSKVAQRLARAAAEQGLTVNELLQPLARKRLAAGLGIGRVSPEQWSSTRKGLEWLTLQSTASRKRCSSCGALVRWVLTRANRKELAIDPLPTRLGNLELLDEGRVTWSRVIRKNEISYTGPRFRAHFATCPHAPTHRRSAPAPPRGLGLPTLPSRPAQPDGRRWPDSTVMCPAGDGYVSQELVDLGIRRHMNCPPDLTPDELARLDDHRTLQENQR